MMRLSLLLALAAAAEHLVIDDCDGDCALSMLQLQQKQLDPEGAVDPTLEPAAEEPAEVTAAAKDAQVDSKDGNVTKVESPVESTKKEAEDAVTTKDPMTTTEDPKVATCANQTDCPSNRTCVFKEDKSWSQCIPKDDKSFQLECRYWDRKMRLAAIKATDMQCDSVKCEYDQDCEIGTVCVSKPDGSWAQCVPLNKEEFQNKCVTWEDDFRLAGIRATNFNCPNSRCYSQDWCVRGARCALQANGEWGQCIMCHEKSFQTNCYSWRPQFIPAAETACHRKCLFDAAFEDGSDKGKKGKTESEDEED